ncbi:MAG: hypothetical protein A2Z42_03410 [Candidatus Woykebacteria bacterium RBG_19FT_COMBO_43_10]|uniref:Polysaccharide pyruvyl transferase domain-containing protein n=1 Tax=Candidatus Woykebacteria bacterium RBG_19FT_COMBO_43_10 TaxID=1802598 RepID=A0A1G1WF72_9BACT|nr:MAG: hypothetical protein A2Z42_03410 [Candidatus Woykebacteria bacterium RBG_19FT_COMBO_43_10]
MPPKILITNNYSSANRGDAAILDGLVSIISNSVPRAEIVVLSSSPLVLQKYHRYKTFESLINSGKVKRHNFHLYLFRMIYLVLWGFFYRIFKIQLPKVSKSKQIDLYKNSDLVISVGGGYINDNYRPGVITRLFEFYFAKLLSRKVILWSHSIGPFNHSAYKFLARFFLSRVDLIATRDNRSIQELKQLDIQGPYILQTFDSAFALSNKINSDDKLQKFVPNRQFISISVRFWPFYENKEYVYRNYIKQMVHFCDWLIGEGFMLVFVSTTPKERHIDDVRVAEEIKAGIINKNKALIIREVGYNNRDLIDFYRRAYINIGTRMHSTILAALAGTPSLAIAYEFKSQELFSMLGIKEFVVEQERFSSEELKYKFSKLVNERLHIKKLLAKKCEIFALSVVNDFEINAVPMIKGGTRRI